MGPPPETNTEPSIEEILDSIRQIISDEDSPEGKEDEKKPATAKPPEDDIVELTERAPDPKPAPPPKAAEPPPAPPPPPAPEPEKEVIQVDMKEAEVAKPVQAAPPPRPEPERPPVQRAPMTRDTDDSLESVISSKTEAIAAGAFGELAQRAAIEKGGQVTIEDVVRYEVRPLLRAWIDKHLPGIVERLLQKELERISRRFDED